MSFDFYSNINSVAQRQKSISVYTIYLFFVCVSVCCGQKTGQLQPANKSRFAFEFSNNDPEKIGRNKFDDGSERSVTSICRSGDHIYLTDPIHHNIKRLSISTGDMESSQSINDVGELLDVLMIDSSLLVVSSGGFLVILDSKLQIGKTIRLPLNPCTDMRFLRKGSKNFVFCHGEITQDKTTYDVTIPALKIEAGLTFTPVSLKGGKGIPAYLNLMQGYELLKGDSCLRRDFVTRCIDRTCPIDQRFPTTRVASFAERSVTLFDVEDNHFVVYSYDW